MVNDQSVSLCRLAAVAAYVFGLNAFSFASVCVCSTLFPIPIRNRGKPTCWAEHVSCRDTNEDISRKYIFEQTQHWHRHLVAIHAILVRITNSLPVNIICSIRKQMYFRESRKVNNGSVIENRIRNIVSNAITAEPEFESCSLDSCEASL